MVIRINPSTLSGAVYAPSSKSMTHRYLIISALANGTSIVTDPLRSDDTYATVDAIKKLGVRIREEKNKWYIEGGTLSSPSSNIDCKESGTTLRFMTGLCSLLKEPCTLTGSSSLLRRPNAPLLDALSQLGVETFSKGGYPPITIKGKLKGGAAIILGNISSQFISSIILASPYASQPVDLKINDLESKPYVYMTLDAMRTSGLEARHSDSLNHIYVPKGRYNTIDIGIEGDWSSAAFLLAAGSLSGKVHVDNLKIDSCQADRKILSIFDEMGVYYKIKGKRVTTEQSRIKAICANLSNSPDIFPIVSSLCSLAKGKSRLTGLGRLKIKESDRLFAMTEGLKKMGVKTSVAKDSVIIEGGNPVGAIIDPHNDHRIAMSFAILALKAKGTTTIMNPECVTKSYPEFWDDLKKIGARID